MQRTRQPLRAKDPGLKGPLFPPQQAFVVHLRSGSDASGLSCAGRVEHVVSGRSAHFQSSADLLGFMHEVLCELGQEPGARKSDPSTLLVRRTLRSPRRDRDERDS